jgi:hypothetical protein
MKAPPKEGPPQQRQSGLWGIRVLNLGLWIIPDYLYWVVVSCRF